jgi:hypothetical protein
VEPFEYTIYPIKPTFVGNVGDSFFVGAFVQCPDEVLPALAYQFIEPPGQSWFAASDLGKGSVTDLAANEVLLQPQVNYLIRALALDCNNNGVWDQCDIDSGFSADANTDSIPDECQPACATADVTGNGMIDVDDLLAVINHWGACSPTVALVIWTSMAMWTPMTC